MPVEPQPCAPGGGDTDEGCCSPSITSQPLCRADGTPILLVVRSGCACGSTPAGDPETAGWIDPVTGTFTPGPAPAGAGPCDGACLDVTTVQLCDLTPGGGCVPFLRHLVRDCDGAITSTTDTALDGTTAYTVAGAAGDCSACAVECVDTICVQRCDDTDGDGQADATYSELWCVRADGGAELVLTYQADPSTPYTPIAPVECTYGCPETETVTLCDASGPFLRRYTFLTGQASYEDVELDGQTPHIVTGTVGVCASDSDCLDTVCRTRCDDTDGDGQADATYSELWCIHADGSADLVLTYQDDPSTPYTPVSPVDCEHGAIATEALTLCDDAGPFLRCYTWVGGAASFEDSELDGATPHVVTGTVGLCPAVSDCEAPTTPAATLGLCLADGTPIAVLVTRDCSGTVTQDGWLNLTTGAYSAGDPPAGTMACGNPRSITTAGTFCDVDPVTGDVLGLVLIEYTYGADGAVTAVRLVDATTGQTYTPQGEVTTCPVGVEQPERDLLQLCDTAAGGAVTQFVRNYARDENGQITGHTDYLLDGTPYTAAGTVGVCPTESACRDCTTHVLCDTDASPPATIAGTAAAGTLPNGVTWTSTGPSAFPPSTQGDGAAWWGVALFPNPVVPLTTYTFNQPVTAEFSVVMVYVAGTAPGQNMVQLPAGAVPLSLPPGYTYNWATGVLSADATLTGCAPLQAPTRATSARFRITGVSSFGLRYLGPRTLLANCRRFGNWVFGAVDVSLGGEFLRTVCRDCSGAVTSTADTLLDGTTPYMPTGTVGQCPTEVPGPVPVTPDTFHGELVLCDDAGPFIRKLVQDAAGAVTSVVNLTLGGAPYTPTGTVGLCPAQEEPGVPVEPDTEVVQLCDVAADGSSTPFLRALTYPAGGGTPTVADTALDGTTPYTPAGTVGVCPAPTTDEPCRNSSTLLLCDLPTDGSPAATVTDTSPTPYYPYATGLPVAGAQALWDGGTLNLAPGTGPQPGTVGTVNSLAATIQAPRPACDTGIAHVTVSVRVQQTGPDDGCGPTGHLRLFNGTTQTALTVLPANTPNGYFGTLTVEADVPAADLAAGSIAVALALDAYDDSGGICPGVRHTGWQLSGFTSTTTYDQAGCDTQFLRNVTTDCETGAVTAVVDTTLDGQPYTPTGEPGQCSAAGGSCCPEQPCPAQTVIQECRCDDTDGDGLPDVGYVELLAVDCQGTVTSLGTYTDGLTGPYTPVAPVACDAAEAEGAPPAFGVQAHRVELAAGGAPWDASAIPTLQSVTAVAHGGTGTITTVDGASTLHAGEAATWSVARDEDAALTGPLTITPDSGTVTITWTQGVTL